MKAYIVLFAGIVALLTSWSGAALAQDGYRVRQGDVLRIEVLEDPALNRSALVLPDGRVSLPLAGSVRAVGHTVEEIQSAFTSQLADDFAVTPNVFVSVERLAEQKETRGPVTAAVINIYVMGEATRPGKLAVAPGTTVLQLFAEMGGFSKFAATKRVQLRRTDRRTGVENVYAIDYDAIERGASTAGNTVLADGDVIVVPQRRLFE